MPWLLGAGCHRESVGLARCQLRFAVMLPDQHQITNVDDCRKKEAKDEGNLTDINGVDQHHDTAGDAQVPELDWNNAAFQPFRNVPLNDEATREKEVRDQAEKRPESELAGQIGPEIVQIMGQGLFIAFRWACRKLLRARWYRFVGRVGCPFPFKAVEHHRTPKPGGQTGSWKWRISVVECASALALLLARNVRGELVPQRISPDLRLVRSQCR
jgi:hypothetical protein